MKRFQFDLAIFLVVMVTLCSCSARQQVISENIPDISPNDVVPSVEMIEYQKMEFMGFIHYSMKTYIEEGKKGMYGNEDPAQFNPTELNTDQWAKTAKEAGMKQLILTAKHHDGFCLWPSKYTEHCVKNSPYKNGKGDVVGEFVASCRKYGLKVGLYLSPWDKNHKDYGFPEYITYYKNQLEELLTQYGEINEIWFDGCMRGDGYYGGAREKRSIDKATYYDWPSIHAFVKKIQPDIKIFSDAGPDVHWIGNEKGFAGETFWSMLNTENIVVGKANTGYLNRGDANGKQWVVGQVDVSIRPSWHYEQREDRLVKTPQKIMDIWFKSVGRNAVLLLNFCPDRRGLIHDNDLKAIREFKTMLDSTFVLNLAKGAEVNASNTRLNNKKFAPENAIDDDTETYWATNDSIFPAIFTVKLPVETEFDIVQIQEPIRFGQRVSKFKVDIFNDSGWETVYEGTTIGYKRLLKIKPVSTKQVRLRIIGANNTVAISNFGLFSSSDKEFSQNY